MTTFEKECVEALTDVVACQRDCGSIVDQKGRPLHRVGCECGFCAAIRLVAFAEGGGRCVICGCTDNDACESGCAWADAAHYVCTAHPKAAIAAAKRLVAKRAKEVGRRA